MLWTDVEVRAMTVATEGEELRGAMTLDNGHRNGIR